MIECLAYFMLGRRGLWAQASKYMILLIGNFWTSYSCQDLGPNMKIVGGAKLRAPKNPLKIFFSLEMARVQQMRTLAFKLIP